MAGDRSFSRYDSAPTIGMGARRARPSASDPVLLALVARFPGRWQAIAKMSGYSEPDIRSVFDKTAAPRPAAFSQAAGSALPAPAEGPEGPDRAPNDRRARGLESIQGRILADIAGREQRTRPEWLAASFDMTLRDVYTHAQHLKARGFIEGQVRVEGGWAATELGRQRLRDWAKDGARGRP